MTPILQSARIIRLSGSEYPALALSFDNDRMAYLVAGYLDRSLVAAGFVALFDLNGDTDWTKELPVVRVPDEMQPTLGRTHLSGVVQDDTIHQLAVRFIQLCDQSELPDQKVWFPE